MISLLVILSISFLPNLIGASIPFLLNPGCDPSLCTGIDHQALYYANHTVDDKLIHIIYSTFDELTISIFETAKNYGPTFNYTALFETERNYTAGITFTDSKPDNSFSFIPRRLLQYNDTDDEGILKGKDNVTNEYDLKNIMITNITLKNNRTNQPTIRLPLDMIGGSLNIDIVYPGETQRDSQFPKLKTAPKSFFINMAIQANNFSLPNTRFAIELYLILPNTVDSRVFSSRYIDDQYTPGIFNVWQMRSDSELYPSSMLWKPVVYQSSDRTIEKNTLMQVSSVNKLAVNTSVDKGIFLSLLPVPPPAVAFNISLGQAQDGFFAKENYTFIQFTAGLDILEPDSTVKFVTVALIISLALPALVGIIAVIFILKRRCTTREPHSSYGAIQD